MQVRSPVSRGSFSLRFAPFDVVWAFTAPILVLWIRGAQALSADDLTNAAVFCALSFLSAAAAFLVFRLRDGLAHLFSVHDALAVGKAVVLTELLTAFFMFSVARLEGIPRSVLILHALLLAAGLVGVRAVLRMASSDERGTWWHSNAEHVIFLGANKLTALYISFLRSFAPGRYEIVGILDDAPGMSGRSVARVRVLGTTDEFFPLIQEFRDHGIHISRAFVASAPDALTEEARLTIAGVCRDFDIQLEFVPALVGLTELQSRASAKHTSRPLPMQIQQITGSSYGRKKRVIDFFGSLILVLLLAPIALIVGVLVLLDVGSPILFWQRRAGLNGRIFQLYKFRTLKPSFDRLGNRIADEGRLSWAGACLRKFRLDELPQLLNVLVGDMSLIGPRPLLPKDQPADPSIRLSVRPGITGWAQVNGGTLLTPAEKTALDEWYVKHASFWVDAKIIYKTLLVMARGESRMDTPAAPEKTCAISAPAVLHRAAADLPAE